MLTRLPLEIVQHNHTPRRNNNTHSSTQQNKVMDFKATHCLSCCQIVLNLFVINFSELRANEDFSAYWCKFTNILARNINAMEKGSSLYNQLLDTIIALFKLLKPMPHSVEFPHQTLEQASGIFHFLSLFFYFYLYAFFHFHFLN